MTVTAAETRVEYAGNGSTTVFTYPYQFFQSDDLDVWLFNDTTGEGTEQVLGTDYAVSGAMSPTGGSVTFQVAPPAGHTAIIINSPDLVQPLHYVNADDFPAASHEQGLDRLTKIAQRLSDRIDRAVRAPDYAPADQVPDAETLVDLVEDAQEAAAEAQVSADNANAASSAAQTYANQSQTAAVTAAGSATSANSSASSASASAAAAADSAAEAEVTQVIWKGPWSALTTYGKYDGVSDNGSSFISLQDGNTNHVPVGGLGVWWDVLAAKGADGAGTGTGDMLGSTNLAQTSAGGGGITNTVTARTNLGLKGAAILDVGTVAGTVAAGDDSRIVNAAPVSSLPQPATAVPSINYSGGAVGTGTKFAREDHAHPSMFSTVDVPLAASFDLNTLWENGFYRVQTPVNGPGVAGETFYHVRVQAGNTNFIIQEAWTYTAVPVQYFYRCMVNTTWGPWLRVVDPYGQASTAEFLANNFPPNKAYLTGTVAWAAAVEVTVPYIHPMVVDFSTGINFLVNIGGAGTTIANPTNQKGGQTGTWRIYHYSGGTITTWGSNFFFPGGVKPLPATFSGQIDILSYYCAGAGFLYCSYLSDVK